MLLVNQVFMRKMADDLIFRFRLTKYSLYPCIPRPSRGDIGIGFDEFFGYDDALQVFRAFVAYLRFHTNTKRRAMPRGQVFAVHSMGQDGLRVKSIKHIDAFGIPVIPEKIDKARGR